MNAVCVGETTAPIDQRLISGDRLKLVQQQFQMCVLHKNYSVHTRSQNLEPWLAI